MIRNMDWIRSQRRLQYACRDLVHQAIIGFSDWKKLSSCECKLRYGSDNICLVVPSDKPAWFDAHKCNNRWGCPICSSRYLNDQRKKIKQVFLVAKQQGYFLAMVTFTHPHSLGQGLKDLIEHHNSARSKMKSGSKFQKIGKAIGYMGSVSVNQVLWGAKHGWHFHTHEIWIIKDTGALLERHTELSRRWVQEWMKGGTALSETQECDMRLCGIHIMADIEPKIASYLCSYDISSEKNRKDEEYRFRRLCGDDTMLRESHPNEQLYNPFSLLRSNISNREELFREYLAATKGKTRIRCPETLEKSPGRGYAKEGGTAEDDEDIFLQKYTSTDKEESFLNLYGTGDEEDGGDTLAEECQYMEEVDDDRGYVFKPHDIKDDDDDITVAVTGEQMFSSDEPRRIPLDIVQFSRICHCGDAMAKVLEFAEALGDQADEKAIHDFIDSLLFSLTDKFH